jgi:hypothetical protein
MEAFYTGLLLTIGVLGYKEHVQLCKLQDDLKELKVILNQNKIELKQKEIKISLKDLFD